MLKISVIIPVYNASNYLEKCVNSVLEQTYSNLEILLIDDGSTDGSSEICDAFSYKDERVIVYHQKNQGVSSARNKALDLSTGDIITFVDADDYLDVNMYEILMNLLDDYNADIVHCGYKHIVGEEVRLIHDTKKIYPQNQGDAIKCLVGASLFTGGLWNKLFRKENIREIRFDRELKNNEDILFNYFAFLKADKIVFADYALYNYVAHINSSACFTIDILKKTVDSCKVNRIIYEDLITTELSDISAQRYINSLAVLYRVAKKSKDKKLIKESKESIWRVYKGMGNFSKKTKVQALMIHYIPFLYNSVYYFYNKIRKPNWEVRGE